MILTANSNEDRSPFLPVSLILIWTTGCISSPKHFQIRIDFSQTSTFLLQSSTNPE